MVQARQTHDIALAAKAAAEARGYAVRSVEIEGKRFKLEFITTPGGDDLELLDFKR
jgi:hypothetical protein